MKLEHKTNKGKERLSRHGHDWDIIRTADGVQFSDLKGNWAFIRSRQTGDERWINLIADKDFTVEDN